jgi:pimeloyl-ACP methyl ester carboxylesterase
MSASCADHWKPTRKSAGRSTAGCGIPSSRNPVDEAERAFLSESLPLAELLVWPVGHHFPHLEDPARFAALLRRFA